MRHFDRREFVHLSAVWRWAPVATGALFRRGHPVPASHLLHLHRRPGILPDLPIPSLAYPRLAAPISPS
jgi:hypothetical protein